MIIFNIMWRSITIGFAVSLIAMGASVAGAQTRRAGPDQMYPDHALTPGAADPAITQANIASTICHKGWSTRSERDKTTSEEDKEKRYADYHIPRPPHD